MKVKRILSISKLLFKEVSNTISTTEETELSELVKTFDISTEYTSKILNQNRLKTKLEEHASYNYNNAYESFLNKVSNTKKIRLATKILRYAAGITILSGLFYLFSTKTFTTETKLARLDIKPGESKAILVLSDNRQIDLTSSSAEKIETNNSLITNESGNLRYQNTGNSIIEKLNTLIIPRGGEYRLELSDGSVVYINSDSKLIFPETFVGSKRKVQLLKGEAFFKVTENKTKPFIVETNDYKINVLGTTFNVRSYKHETNDFVTLVEGQVALKSEAHNIILTPNKQAIINKKNGSVWLAQVEASYYSAWKDGKFVYKDIALETIIEDLSRWYDAEVFFQNQSMKQIRFSLNANRKNDINQILEALELTKTVKFDIKNRTIVVTSVD